MKKNKVVNRANYKETLLNIKEIIQYLISSAPKSEYGIVGIGVAVPGIVNNDGSNILLAPNLGWKNVNLKHDLEEEYNIPVIIHNEANAGAYGEKHFGSGKDFENLIYLSAGIGIGVGFILNNELYRGADGFSGEMGHMMIDINGRECSCGSTGCWELYASEQALINQVEYLETIIQKDPNLELLIELAQDNEEIRILFYHIGRYLGLGISNIINTFNPKQIIIGNRLALAKELLIQPIMEAVETHSLRYNQKNIKINFAELSNYSAALGISAFVTEFFLKPGLNEKI